MKIIAENELTGHVTGETLRSKWHEATKTFALSLLAAGCLFGTGINPVSAEDKIPEAPREWKELEYKLIGPGKGGYMMGCYVRPGEPNYVIMGGDMGNTFWSEDYGKSWNICNPQVSWTTNCPTGAISVLYDRRDRNMIWMGTSAGVYLTKDHFKTWELMTPDYVKGHHPFDIVQDPKDPNIIWVGCAGAYMRRVRNGKGPLLYTRDNGKTWTKVSGSGGFPGETETGIWAIVIDPASEFKKGVGHKRICVASNAGLFISNDFGATWQKSEKGISPGYVAISDIDCVVKDGKSHLFACAWYVVKKGDPRPASFFYVSDDGGKTWQPGSTRGVTIKTVWQGGTAPKPERLGEETPVMEMKALDTKGPNMSFCDKDPNVVWMVCGWQIYRSADFGKTWSRVKNWYKFWEKVTFPSGLSTYIVVNNPDANHDSGWTAGAEGTDRITATADPEIAYVTDDPSITRDGGKTWANMEDERVVKDGKDFWKNKGESNLCGERVTTDPLDYRKVFTGFDDASFFVSHDGGETTYCPTQNKNVLSSGIDIYHNVFAVCYDPLLKKLWCSQESKEGKALYVSGDDGFTFTRVGKDVIDSPIVDIVINPDSPAEKRQIFLAVPGKGILRSNDGGASWKIFNDGTMGTSPGIMRLAWGRAPGKGQKNVLLATVARKKQDVYGMGRGSKRAGSKSNSTPGLYRSEDEGETWTRVLDGVILNVKVHATHPDIAYCVGQNGLYKSIDQGKTWKLLFKPLTYFLGLDLHPANPDIVYFGHKYHHGSLPESVKHKPYGLYKTVDGGKSFIYLGKNMPGKILNDIRVCPDKPEVIYVMTYAMGCLRVLDPDNSKSGGK